MKLAIVTGANSGIGKATAKALMLQGNEVILICRNKERGEQTLSELKTLKPDARLHLYLCDLSSIKDVRHISDEIRRVFTKIDILVNNAGSYFSSRKESVDGHELTFATNHLGAFQLTNQLLPLLKNAESARIINVSSEAHMMSVFNPDDLELKHTYSGKLAYANSKLYNILFTYGLAERLKHTRISVNAMHPGGVNTNFGKHVDGLLGLAFRWLGWLMRTPEKGAETIIWLATSPEATPYTGKYFLDKKVTDTLHITNVKEETDQLWTVSEQLINNKILTD